MVAMPVEAVDASEHYATKVELGGLQSSTEASIAAAKWEVERALRHAILALVGMILIGYAAFLAALIVVVITTAG